MLLFKKLYTEFIGGKKLTSGKECDVNVIEIELFATCELLNIFPRL